ncbi:hypothetical protein ILUMI_23857, partial [Ignelater luminosus]
AGKSEDKNVSVINNFLFNNISLEFVNNSFLTTRQARELQRKIKTLLIKTKSDLEEFNQLKINTETLKSSLEDTEIKENEEKNILLNIKTTFVPPHNSMFELSEEPIISHTRKVRDIQISDIHLKNKSDLAEDKVLYWEIPNVNNTNMEMYKNVNHEKFDDIQVDLIKKYNNDNFILQRLFWRNGSAQEEVRRIQAGTMKRYMDNSVNPCDDFYQYACGNWDKYHPIPPDKIRYDMFEVLRESLDRALRDLLTDEDMDVYKRISKRIANNPEDAIIKVKNFYKSCMNEELIGQRGEKPLLKLLKQLGGWPIIDLNWNEAEFDWIWLMAQLRLYNNDILISELVGPDIRNANEYIIQIDQTTLGLPSKQYFLHDSNIKYLEAYRVYMITVANLLGASIVNATQDVDDMINFEIDLASIIESPEQRKNISEEYVKVTIAEMHALVPEIDWIRYFSMIMNNKVHANHYIVSFCMRYLQDLVVLVSQTPPRTVANYLLWRFVRNRINNLDNRFQDAKQRFYYILFGREKSPPRWQTCVSQVNLNMGMALGSLFVQQYFDEESKNDTLQMTREIQQSFRELLSHASWLDGDTKILARVKIDAMRLRIGYPDFILNHEELTERYKDVTVKPDLYFENTLSILQHLTQREHAKLGTVVDKLMWTAPPAVVNAYYSRNKNQIMFPAGILQPPFYQRHFPRSLNYGGIGVVIGHEVTHGFDDTGRLFDKEGNLHRWWKNSAVLAFHGRSQCLIDQYNKYTVPEVSVHVDGVSTQGENIADNGGLKQAYKAYTKWLEKNPYADETLPGLNLSNTQMFFLNFAQVWCGSSRIEGMRNKLKRDVHAPGRYRVIGSISNLKEFSDAYGCPLGSPMNPPNKCSIW